MPTFPGGPGRPSGRRGFHEPIVPPEARVREVASVGFPDLVRMLAEGIADAQLNLDRTSASLVEELASKEVSIVPEVRERIDAEGNVSYEQAPARRVSLLEIGITPAFYQFSQATVEVSMDLEIVEDQTGSSSEDRRIGLRAGTAALRAERKLHREVAVHSKLTATLVPVPMPAHLEPSRTTTREGS